GRASDRFGGLWSVARGVSVGRTDAAGEAARGDGGDGVWIWDGVVFVAWNAGALDMVGDDRDNGDVRDRIRRKPGRAGIIPVSGRLCDSELFLGARVYWLT